MSTETSAPETVATPVPHEMLLGCITMKWALDLRNEAVAAGDKKVGAYVLKRLKKANLALWERLQQLASETTYERRRYGQCHFYVWSYHPNFGGHDPYPAAHFPNAEVCWDHLMAICTRAEQAAAGVASPT